MSLVTPPQSDPELILQLHQRLNALEASQTVRIGDWVLTQDRSTGLPILVAPGQTPLALGTTALPADVQTALRGYALTTDVANAVSGGATNDLSAATATTVAQNAATGNAQYSADNAQAAAAKALAILGAGSTGYLWADSFDEPEDRTGIGPRYSRVYDSGGEGNYGLDGIGNINSGSITGALPHDWIDLHDTPTNTDKQLLTATMNTVPEASGGTGGTSDSNQALIGRWDGTIIGGVPGNAVVATWDNTTAYVDIFVAGVRTRLGSQGIAQANGDRWDFQVGTDIDPYQLILLRNELTVIPVTDAGHVHNVGAAYRQGGLWAHAGTKVFFWITSQMGAPSMQAFNFADRSVGF